MLWVMRIVGTVVTVGLIAVSLMMNFRFGQSLGRTEWDGLVYGLASACADGFKVILPFAIMAAWRSRRVLAAGVGGALWLVFTAYSMTSSLGHSAVNRAETSGIKRHEIATYQDLRRTLEVRLREREKLAEHRPAAAVEAAIGAAEISPRWISSKKCSDVFGRETRTFCDSYSRMKAELAVAQRAAELDGELSQLRDAIGKASGHGASGEGDAQMAILRQLSGLAEDYVRLALTLLVSIMVELGSGLGLYVVFGHRREEAEVGSAPSVPPIAHRAAPPLLPSRSDELEWRRRRLIVDGRQYESEIDLYRDYCRWTVNGNRGPALTLTEFRAWLEREKVGELARKNGRNYYRGLRLRDAAGEKARVADGVFDTVEGRSG